MQILGHGRSSLTYLPAKKQKGLRGGAGGKRESQSSAMEMFSDLKHG